MAQISFRDLDSKRYYKPLDFGNGRVSGSITRDGQVLALSTYHPEFGYITLSGQPPFPDEKRFDQAAVRAYRARMAELSASGIGLLPDEPWTQVSAGLLEDAIPCIRLTNASLQAQVTTWAIQGLNKPPAAAVQEWQLENISGQMLDWSFIWGGLIHLTRASMTQLTEGGVIPLPSADITVSFSDDVLVIHNSALDSAVAILGLPPIPPFHQDGTAVKVPIPGNLDFQPDESKTITITFAFGRTPAQARQRAERYTKLDLHAGLDAICQTAKTRWGQIDSYVPSQVGLIGHRALSYALNCCTLRVNESNCLLTDHQILPLSWTRDAYYIAAALMSQPGKRNLDIVRRHLLWLFEHAQRPDGYWGRAYLPNGYLKDHVFQLDQQCYPLLELTDYEKITDDQATLRRLVVHTPSLLETILERMATNVHLFATEETPGDDPLALPYHFSSQVLLWHTLRRLAALNRNIPFTDIELDSLAQAIQVDIWRYLVSEKDHQQMFVYASDLAGGRLFYHDANDLPTVFAPLWGFCRAGDPVWQATMDFAFSPANLGGFYPGPFGGLGSVHTPGAWPLGDVQEWIYARLTHNQERAVEVLNRLAATACWDGALPEARDPQSGDVRSRHWFAWPNCALLYALSQLNQV